MEIEADIYENEVLKEKIYDKTEIINLFSEGIPQNEKVNIHKK